MCEGRPRKTLVGLGRTWAPLYNAVEHLENTEGLADMLNVFEQPWTLVAAGVFVLFAVLTFRSVVPEKRRWWQWLVPLLVAGCGFGVDSLVQTEREKITAVIETGIRAVKREDCAAIASIIAEDYSDSLHNSKAALMRHCSTKLAKPIIEKARITGLLVESSAPNAKVTLFAKITFTDDSYVARDYKKWLLIKVRLYLRQTGGRGWLINRVEILEVDKQPFTWRGV
jgi:hypothetical protein